MSGAAARRLLIFAWEFPGAATPAGTALARRVGQVARGFALAGWDVDVVHRIPEHSGPASPDWTVDHLAEGGTVRRRSVPGPGVSPMRGRWAAPLRWLATAWHAHRHGDRSGRWAARVKRGLVATRGAPPDLVVAFYTPRGPLALGAWAHRQWGVPWIADLQDEALGGCGPVSRPLAARWMRRTLRSAALVAQVSPEWAEADSRLLQRPVTSLRHAVPNDADAGARHGGASTSRRGELALLYAGWLDARAQDPRPLMRAVCEVNRTRRQSDTLPVVVRVAGARSVYDAFREALAPGADASAVQWLGWLDPAALRQALRDADCLVVVPWARADRRVIPSKLFEYVGTGKPVLVAGPDSGAFDSLEREWRCGRLVLETAEAIADALSRALDGDTGGLLVESRCAAPPLRASDLASQYLAWADALLGARPGASRVAVVPERAGAL